MGPQTEANQLNLYMITQNRLDNPLGSVPVASKELGPVHVSWGWTSRASSARFCHMLPPIVSLKVVVTDPRDLFIALEPPWSPYNKRG
jgi:hypothetical protein